MRDKRIVLTGGAGFIGSRLTRTLAAAGARCWVFDNLHPQVHGEDAKVPDLGEGSVFVRGDVADAPALKALVGEVQPDVVYHLAAETGTGQSMDEPARYCRVNVMGTANLLEAMHACATPPARLVLPSSRAIYGEGAYLTAAGDVVVPPPRDPEAMSGGRFEPEIEGAGPLQACPTPEDVPLRPCSVYASTKLMQEHLVQQTSQDQPWRTAILRLQNVYGPGQSLRNPYTGVLSIFTQLLKSGATLNVFEDGQIVRDFVYVDDVVQAFVLAGDPERPSVLANIGSGETTTILQAVHELAGLLGRQGDVFRISGDFRVGDIRHAVADIRRARAELGWAPRMSFPDGLRALVNWAEA